MDKKSARIRRARRTRAKIRELATYRLSIHRTPRHIYAQVFAPSGDTVVAAASTLDKQLRAELKGTGNQDAAAAVGKAIAEKAKAAGISKVAFDRSGFKYHGRVKALADAAREAGLEF
ncbi:50S ribosomal protein L18 [Thiohalobacter sp. IOR34]|uniref:50S ribosomal protein L18 n=1 Tax=Thiohalobacter sp. IOR34 TaxID=3057176 RepID=UPI0025AF9239|nr:50S ribosomal protein L18 [Thiohalobacter sp. IOR34]WJW75032.1 50S ribosomal protein L18 [Thiohalobacter sp. IOR34]